MTLSAYFLPESFFELYGCRTLTLALAKLSCFLEYNDGLFLKLFYTELKQ